MKRNHKYDKSMLLVTGSRSFASARQASGRCLGAGRRLPRLLGSQSVASGAQRRCGYLGEAGSAAEASKWSPATAHPTPNPCSNAPSHFISTFQLPRVSLRHNSPPPPPLGSLSSPRSRSRRSGWPPRPRKGTPTRHFSGRRQHPCPLYNVEYNARLYTRHVVARPWGAVLFEWPARASQPRAVPASRRIESSRRHGRTADAGREDDVELL